MRSAESRREWTRKLAEEVQTRLAREGLLDKDVLPRLLASLAQAASCASTEVACGEEVARLDLEPLLAAAAERAFPARCDVAEHCVTILDLTWAYDFQRRRCALASDRQLHLPLMRLLDVAGTLLAAPRARGAAAALAPKSLLRASCQRQAFETWPTLQCFGGGAVHGSFLAAGRLFQLAAASDVVGDLTVDRPASLENILLLAARCLWCGDGLFTSEAREACVWFCVKLGELWPDSLFTHAGRALTYAAARYRYATGNLAEQPAAWVAQLCAPFDEEETSHASPAKEQQQAAGSEALLPA